MGKTILAVSSGLTVTALMVFILGLTVLHKCYRERNYGYTFWIAISITLFWGAEFVLRFWSTLWREGYLSKEPVAWMLNHGTILWAQLAMILSGILFIKTLTEDSPQGRLWQIGASVILCVIGLSYLKGH